MCELLVSGKGNVFNNLSDIGLTVRNVLPKHILRRFSSPHLFLIVDSKVLYATRIDECFNDNRVASELK